MTKTIPKQSEWLRASISANSIGVDREAKVIRGFVLAQEGAFKNESRGEFDQKGLRQITKMLNLKKGGVKSRLGHPSASGDSIGKFLGRSHNHKNGMVQIERDGELLELNAVRGDLHLDKSSFDTPNGNIGDYILNLAESDPDALSSSLVIKPEKIMRLDTHGHPRLNPDTGEELPPLWYPLAIHAIDIVDEGDAVDGLLSTDGLNDELLHKGYKMLQGFLPDQPRDVVEARLQSWLSRAMSLRFGDDFEDDDEVLAASASDLLRALELKSRKIA